MKKKINNEVLEQITESKPLKKTKSEVVKRLDMAKLYNLILNHSLFDSVDVDKEIVDLVEGEIRGFVTERLEILVGLRQEKKASSDVFDEDEIEVLKALAAKVMSKEPQQLAPVKAAKKDKISTVSEEPVAITPVVEKAKYGHALPPKGIKPVPMPSQSAIDAQYGIEAAMKEGNQSIADSNQMNLLDISSDDDRPWKR